jgi:2-polyprenyl-3-methyl-5-hydroxy-6-metoxy-1,4-benzoquinol methylase
VCGADGAFGPYLTVSMVGAFDAEVVCCRNCGFRQVRPRLTEAEVASLYTADYFDSDAAAGFQDYARQQQRLEREGYFLARRLRRVGPAGRLLEVGCALGFLLDAVKRFSGWQVEGIDISSFAVEFARRTYGLDVRCGALEQMGYDAETFDAVVQKDVLEHVLHPREHLAETGRIMKPGGLLWLVTPNGEANLRPLHGLSASLAESDELPLLDQAHVSFFTRDNLLRLADECGFECVRFRSIRLKRGLASLGVLPKKKRKLRSAPGGRPRGAEHAPAESTDMTRERVDALCETIRAEVERWRRPVRSSKPYFLFRQATRLLGALPGRLPLGNDFEVILRKR